MTERQERLRIRRNEIIIVPETIDQAWLDRFNQQYANQDRVVSIMVEDWLEQPEDDRGLAHFDHEGETSSHNDAKSPQHTLSGTLHAVKNLNLSLYKDKVIPVLVLTDVSLQLPDGDEQLLADGEVILVTLDRLHQIVIKHQAKV